MDNGQRRPLAGGMPALEHSLLGYALAFTLEFFALEDRVQPELFHFGERVR